MLKRKRDVEEGPHPLVCSYCGVDASPELDRDGRPNGAPWRFEVKRHATWWSRHEMLSYNGGAWWMRTLGHPGEWWRRCCWWSELHVAGEEKDRSILLRRCGRCGVEESIMAEAYSTIADNRAEWERAHPEDGKATVRGICTYCGEIIRESSTGPKAFEVLYEDFDELT